MVLQQIAVVFMPLPKTDCTLSFLCEAVTPPSAYSKVHEFIIVTGWWNYCGHTVVTEFLTARNDETRLLMDATPRVWMLFRCVLIGTKVRQSRSPTPRDEGMFSVLDVISASLQTWWMGALCIWRTSGSSPTELHADVILLCVMWSPPWQRITFHRAAHGVLDRNVHVNAWALIKMQLLLSLFSPSSTTD